MRTNNGKGNNGFVIFWVCEDYRIPLNVFQIFSHDNTWYVSVENLTFITLHIYDGGHLYYLDNVFDIEDIRAIADAIEEYTGEKFKDVVIKPDKYPTTVIYRPPLFIPEFRSKEHELRYYRQRAKVLQQEIDSNKSKELKVVWRGQLR